MDHISIIIVHFNTPQETKECLKSLEDLKAKNFKFNVIIVDNGSKKPLKLNQSYLDKNFEVIRSESNLGFTGGNNLGISYAIKKYQSDYLLLLNSDTIVDSKFLEIMHQSMMDSPDAGLANPMIYFYKGNEFFSKSYRRDQKGKVIWYAGGSIDWLNLVAFHRGVDEIDRGQFALQSESDFATGCALLIKREVVERIGILDKKYFLYMEDVDYSVRAKRAGFRVLFIPNAFIWHKNAGSSDGAGSKIHDYYQTRNRFLFVFKHGNLKNKLLTILMMFKALKENNSGKTQAVFDLILQKFGKQQII